MSDYTKTLDELNGVPDPNWGFPANTGTNSPIAPLRPPAPPAPPAPTTVGSTDTSTVSSTSSADPGSLGRLNSLLSSYGLGSLTDFVKQELISGVSEDQVALDIQNQQAFKDRFPAIAQRNQANQQRMSQGLSPLPPLTPTDYLNYERTARDLFQAAGLPQGLFDDKDTVTNLLTNDVSASELQARISQGYDKVANADPAVRQYFNQAFGAGQGDGYLASMFLDPTKATTQLLQTAGAAEVGGMGLQQGFDVSAADALSASQQGVTQDAARSAFERLNQQRGYLTQTVGERETGSGLTQNQGVEAALGLSGQAEQSFQHEQDVRGAQMEGGGGSQITQQGVMGLGGAGPT